jgi:hypothetical protein
MSNLSLFDLNQMFNQFMELVARREGEISEDEEQNLVVLEQSLLAKADSCAFVLDKLGAEADFYKAQAERLMAFSKVCANAQERLKGRITEAVKLSPDKYIRGDLISFQLKKNPPSVVVLDESKIPEKFIETVVTRRVDKVAIKSAIKSGETVEGCELAQGESLSVTRPKK